MRTEPWITRNAINVLDDFFKVNKDPVVLEFGSGGSTIWMSKRTKFLTSIEHDKKWYDDVTNCLQNDKECNTVKYIHKDRPYYTLCEQFTDNTFDLVFVDGRDRILCIKNSLRLVKPGGLIMLDNAERAGNGDSDYREAYTILKDWQILRTQNECGLHTNFWKKP